MRKTIQFLFVLALLASCAGRNEGNFHLTGTIEGAEGKHVLVFPADVKDIFHGEKPLAKIRIRNNKIEAFLSLDSNSVYELFVPNRKEGGSYAGLPIFVDSPELYVTYSKSQGGDSRIYTSSESPLNAFYSSYRESKDKALQDDTAECHRLFDSLARANTYFTKEYQELFKERKWKLALDAMPLNIPKVVVVDNAGDLLTLRSRASEFSRSGDKKASVSIDFEEKQAIVTVTKK